MPDILHAPDQHLAQIEADKVAYLGPEYSFSELAVRTVFPEAKLEPHKEFEGVTGALTDDPSLIGLVPVRNEVSGDVYPVLSELRSGNFVVLDEASMAIHLVLASRGTRVDRISRVISHPQALKQVSNYLHNSLPNLEYDEIHGVNSTSQAAQMAYTAAGTVAAICSPQAANDIGLNIIDRDVQDNPSNFTRFLAIQSYEKDRVPFLKNLLKREWNRAKVAGLVTLPAEEDVSLHDMLEFAILHDLKTSAKIGSQNDDGSMSYFLEFRGEVNALFRAFGPENEEREAIMDFKLLGAYPVRQTIYEPPATFAK